MNKMKILCTVCRQLKETPHFHKIYKNKKTGWCILCKNISRRKHYRKNKAEINLKRRKHLHVNPLLARNHFLSKYKKFKNKFSARQKLKNAIKIGKIIKLPCIKCNKFPDDAHHPDYSKPLLIIWLCDFHHKEIHNQIYINEYTKIQ